jgi:hypothetical protein
MSLQTLATDVQYHHPCCFKACLNTSAVGLSISLISAVSVEKFLSFQISTASASDKYVTFSCLCKHHFMGD